MAFWSLLRHHCEKRKAASLQALCGVSSGGRPAGSGLKECAHECATVHGVSEYVHVYDMSYCSVPHF